MLKHDKLFRKAKLYNQASIIRLLSLIFVLCSVSTLKADTLPSHMVKIGLMDIPEKENFNLEYFIKEKAYLQLVERDIIPYLKKKKLKPLTCFISYAWGDRYHEFWVKRFCEMLDKVEIEVFLDRWSIRKGNNIL